MASAAAASVLLLPVTAASSWGPTERWRREMRSEEVILGTEGFVEEESASGRRRWWQERGDDEEEPEKKLLYKFLYQRRIFFHEIASLCLPSSHPFPPPLLFNLIH